MKLITLLFTALILTGCTSDNGTTLQNENAFISGNGISLFLEKEDRKSAPKISGPTLDSKMLTLESNRVTVILTRDSISSAKAFYENFNLTYPTFIDDSSLVGFRGSLIPNAIPTTLIIDKDGKVAVRISGEVTVAGMKKMLEKVLADA